jgi:hypothetical protein
MFYVPLGLAESLIERQPGIAGHAEDMLDPILF